MASSEEDGKDTQLEAIFRMHFTDLYQYIYRQVRDVVIAEDLASAVFLKALRWLQQDRSQESVKGWLYATARSTIADYWHEHTQMQLLPLEEAEQMPVLSDESDEQMRPLQARLRTPEDTGEGPITIPADLQAALQQHPAANTLFEKLSYTKKKGFIDRIEQVAGEDARSQRVQQTIEQLEKIHQAHHKP